jgi:hypothetical protein
MLLDTSNQPLSLVWHVRNFVFSLGLQIARRGYEVPAAAVDTFDLDLALDRPSGRLEPESTKVLRDQAAS